MSYGNVGFYEGFFQTRIFEKYWEWNGIGMKDRFQEYGRVGVFMLEEGKIPLGALQSSNRHCSMNDSCTFHRD
jgi:hypothetical protein